MNGIDGYIRVSDRHGREGESYISPSVQREAIQRWADYKGIPILEWHFDEDWSGGASSRPGLDLAVERSVSGLTGGIVSWKIDRFSRATEHGLRDLRRLNEAGARLAFVTEDIDTGTPIGKMVYTIMLSQAEYFLEQIKASWIEAKRRAVDRGASPNRTPFGYVRNADSTLSPHPTIGPIVTEAFRLTASQSLQAAMAYLDHAAPQRRWTMLKVRRLIAGRSYLGEIKSGDFFKADAHPPLVTRAIWEAAQSSPPRHAPAEAFPLSGLMVCATCQQAMTGGRGGIGQRIYRCTGTGGRRTRAANPCATGAAVTADRVEDYVRSQAAEILRGLEVSAGGAEPEMLTLLERNVTEAEVELDAFAADTTIRRALGARYHEHLQERIAALDAARATYREQARQAVVERTFTVDDLLSDPPTLAVTLRHVFKSIVAHPGRGLSIDRKVTLVPLHPHEATREA